MSNPFNEDYYLRGPETNLSNFENYRWMPDATISMAQHVKRYLDLKAGDTFLDVGAARGYLVKAMRILGIDAHGYDISEWAIDNCDPDVRPYMGNYLNGAQYDVVWSKDVFEHIPPDELAQLVRKLCLIAKRRIFLIVPLAKSPGGKYVHEKEERDSTHVNRWTLHGWISFLQAQTSCFIASGAYYYPGLKPGSFEVEHGYGFITMTRI